MYEAVACNQTQITLFTLSCPKRMMVYQNAAKILYNFEKYNEIPHVKV